MRLFYVWGGGRYSAMSNRLSVWQWVALFVALVYVVSPVDFVPEIILGPFGIVDDFAAVGLITGLLLAWRRSSVVNLG